jgi:hypothetical protein
MASVGFFDLPPEFYNGKIPFIVTDLIGQMRILKAEQVVGIFRLSGSDGKIRELVERLDRGPIDNWAPYGDVNVIANTLKRYFRRMAQHEPLIPAELYDCFMALMENSVGDEAHARDVMTSLINDLNPGRIKTLAYFCACLNVIASNSDVNKMTAENLAVCIAPNILPFREGVTEMEALQQNMLGNQAFSLMIKGFRQLFAHIEITPEDFCTRDDIAMLGGAKWDVGYIEHLIERHRLREKTLIPYIAPCRFEIKAMYRRPEGKPVIRGVES